MSAAVVEEGGESPALVRMEENRKDRKAVTEPMTSVFGASNAKYRYMNL